MRTFKSERLSSLVAQLAGVTAAVVLGLGLASPGAFAQNAKATAAVSKTYGCIIDTSSGSTLPAETCHSVFGDDASVATTQDNFVPVMTTQVQLSASQSLFVSPSLVTGLYTNTKTKGSGSTTVSSVSGEGAVFVRAVLLDSAGNTVMVGAPVDECSVDSDILGCASGTSGSNAVYGVVFDQRTQTLTSLLSSCLTTGTSSISCGASDAEFVQLLLKTTSAHTFNFIFPNVGQGTYTLQIQAAVDADADVLSGSGSAIAAAAYGLGDVTVQTVRLVHGFSF